jgi:hypothetical protein
MIEQAGSYHQLIEAMLSIAYAYLKAGCKTIKLKCCDSPRKIFERAFRRQFPL